MLELLGKCISDVSVLRKLIFPAVFLPPDIPNLWTIALEFATAGTISQKCITPDVVKALMENIQTFNATAFDSDEKLFREIVTLDIPGKPLGVPLVSRSQPIPLPLYERGMVWYIAIVCLVLRATGSNAVFKY